MRSCDDKVYKREEIWEQLSAMEAPRTRVVLMHSSLRLIGRVEGGAQGLLDTLISYFTEEGGLFCVPTHTWSNLRKEITLDLGDPKTCLGAFSDLAAADKRALRSENPTHSMAVFGDRKRAEAFVAEEPFITTGTDPRSCYGKLYAQGGYVLLAGVAHNKNTYLHCVEEMLGIPDRLSAEPVITCVRNREGNLRKQAIHSHSCSFSKDISQRFPKYETAFRYHGGIRDGFLGNAPCQLCSAGVMKDVMALIAERSKGKDPLADKMAIPPILYV